MRRVLSSVILFVAVVVPTLASAQANKTPLPEKTAAAADWQVNSEPITVQGLQYSPTREFRIFDGQVMVQIGIFERVPIYADSTVEAFSVVYVPVGGATMRAYEHPRQGALAGTTPSHVPAGSPSVMTTTPAAGTAGTDVPVAVGSESATPPPPPAKPTTSPRRTTAAKAKPRPGASTGIWIEFDGARWYAAGDASVFRAERFTKIGEYRGFPVYHQIDDAKPDRIWVMSAIDGPVAPFVKR